MTSEESSDAPKPDEKEVTAPGAKRVYTPPSLIVYGDARELTQAVGSKNKMDGSGSRKTGF